MNRRTFFAATAGAGLASQIASGATQKSIIELTYIRTRNNSDNQSRRTQEFLEQSVKPAAKRAGAGAIGLFSTVIGEQSPTILVLTEYSSLANMEAVEAKVGKDEAYAKELEAFYDLPGLEYQRIEKTLLRGFDSMPKVEAPESDGERKPRIFEMRIYESDNLVTLHRKMGMFDNGEIELFRKLNMLPVFFGETIVGRNLPNLTYMLGFESLAAREEAWGKFGSSPEWRKMSKLPGLSDAEVVSNISNRIYRPLRGSDIR